MDNNNNNKMDNNKNDMGEDIANPSQGDIGRETPNIAPGGADLGGITIIGGNGESQWITPSPINPPAPATPGTPNPTLGSTPSPITVQTPPPTLQPVMPPPVPPPSSPPPSSPPPANTPNPTRDIPGGMGGAALGPLTIIKYTGNPEPATQPPTTGAPMTPEPATQPPTTGAPITPEPATQPPTTGAPMTPRPVTTPPTTPSPVTNPPMTQSPIPVTNPPTTSIPVTNPPVAQTPLTNPPVTQPPVANPPVTQPPVTNPPTTESPVTNAPITSPPSADQSQEPKWNENMVCLNTVYTDVVIVGAGMAGVSAAVTLQNEDPNLSYVILESTDRVGGRVKSMTFGVQGNEWTVEDGANWIMEFKNNPMWALMEQYDFQTAFNDVEDYTVYNEFGQLVDPDIYQDKMDKLMDAWGKAVDDADEQWTSNHEGYADLGVRYLLQKYGWRVPDDASGNLDFMAEFYMLDWEYAARDTSVRYFPYFDEDDYYHITDPRGYEIVPQQYFLNNANRNSLKTNSRVVKIAYNEAIQNNGKNYQAVVTAMDGSTTCTNYVAQRVISTVSIGVLNHDLIAFDPPLRYPHEKYSPYSMALYVKVFYQFPVKFWDTTEFILTARPVGQRGHCHHWQNMDLPQFMPGSGIIRCEMMTEAFNELKHSETNQLTDETLLALLEPLRITYGAATVGTPLAMYYTQNNNNVDFGYGSYANWKIGKTFTDYAHFFGGIPNVVNHCDHNGCSDSGDWVLHFSGAATCYVYAEFVHGAYWAGERDANYVLESLGYNVKTDKSPCDEDWKWFDDR
ncbi:Polyamine oxidase 1 [Seminavis robusta]|uniref:Polyamine oxidase 1 n=2 Tax=Seminavis robusta TaxID=568900 RepID=A0A9N8HT72_9STRA|nr:Polyamine oxidase 1 [Seminavis robusta]|eukprot:Sro1244_g255600.1 Polyamine oxidase 1 (792) ;mRNA; f:22104-24665